MASPLSPSLTAPVVVHTHSTGKLMFFSQVLTLSIPVYRNTGLFPFSTKLNGVFSSAIHITQFQHILSALSFLPFLSPCESPFSTKAPTSPLLHVFLRHSFPNLQLWARLGLLPLQIILWISGQTNSTNKKFRTKYLIQVEKKIGFGLMNKVPNCTWWFCVFKPWLNVGTIFCDKTIF